MRIVPVLLNTFYIVKLLILTSDSTYHTESIPLYEKASMQYNPGEYITSPKKVNCLDLLLNDIGITYETPYTPLYTEIDSISNKNYGLPRSISD